MAKPAKLNRRQIGILITAAVILIIAANVHLLYVAVSSQPDCVPHIKNDSAQDNSDLTAYTAAKSVC